SAKIGLTAAMKGPQRTPGASDRDASRHPVKTMEVFGLRPDMRVFEVGPGRGWWTELLAVVLAQRGQLVIAGPDPKSDDTFTSCSGRVTELMIKTKSPELYGKVELVPNASVMAFEMGPPESLDMVLTMRMAHNLVRFGQLEKFLAAAFAALKPGGVLAIEQHR